MEDTTMPKDELYRGYWIKRNYLNGGMWIERDGHYIQSCLSMDEGRRIIDAMLGD